MTDANLAGAERAEFRSGERSRRRFNFGTVAETNLFCTRLAQTSLPRKGKFALAGAPAREARALPSGAATLSPTTQKCMTRSRSACDSASMPGTTSPGLRLLPRIRLIEPISEPARKLKYPNEVTFVGAESRSRVRGRDDTLRRGRHRCLRYSRRRSRYRRPEAVVLRSMTPLADPEGHSRGNGLLEDTRKS